MTRFVVRWACLLAGMVLMTTAAKAALPNIILLLADDLGYRDLSCFGSPAVRTPNLDRLAAEGMKMTHFYAASAVCSPTRAAILTGRYPLRFGITKHFNRPPHTPSPLHVQCQLDPAPLKSNFLAVVAVPGP